MVDTTERVAKNATIVYKKTKWPIHMQIVEILPIKLQYKYLYNTSKIKERRPEWSIY